MTRTVKAPEHEDAALTFPARLDGRQTGRWRLVDVRASTAADIVFDMSKVP